LARLYDNWRPKPALSGVCGYMTNDPILLI
jgi:hypothetical protein